MYAVPSTTTTFDEYLNEQLINCLNLQTNVIQNLSQYSQHISLQLIEIKNNVNILTNRILNLQQQQSYVQIPPPPPPPPSNPLLFFPPAFQHPHPTPNKPLAELPINPAPFSFSTTVNEQPSRSVPFIFGPLSSNNITYLDENEEEEDDDNESPISFPPIVHLSPVEVKTGEEDENILFCERAKLYRFDSSINEMKERGVGEIKILRHKITKQYRILMRREQILKICANHIISSQLELKPHQGTANAYVWSVIDFSDGEAKHETLCVKFKTDEQAKQFVKIFNESKGGNTNDLSLIERISLNDDDDDDIILLDETKPTIEQIERAKKLQLPLTFYLYENKTPCTGCRGCRDDLPSLNEMQFINRINSNFPSAFFPNSSLPSLMSMVPNWLSDVIDLFPTPPKDQRTIIKAKRSLPSNRLPPPSVTTYEQISSEISRTDDASTAQTNQKKSRNLSDNNLITYSYDNYASKIAENILDQVKQELCNKQIPIVTTQENNSKLSNSGFSFTDFQVSPKTNFIFGNTLNMSFSDLVKQSSSITDDTEKQEDSFLTTENSDESTISFPPIVHLSPVEVKTGEEDENILFCERAKLYRFDSSINQMKERGVGEIKILQHKITKQCRILMRRDKILKICANHIISSQLELKSHQNSENTYVWSVMDFADGKAKHEILCVKFKTSDIAKTFFQQFNDAKIVK